MNVSRRNVRVSSAVPGLKFGGTSVHGTTSSLGWSVGNCHLPSAAAERNAAPLFITSRRETISVMAHLAIGARRALSPTATAPDGTVGRNHRRGGEAPKGRRTPSLY